MEEELIESAERVLRAAINNAKDRNNDSATVRDLCAATNSLEQARLAQAQVEVAKLSLKKLAGLE
jgi:hypothetical protein